VPGHRQRRAVEGGRRLPGPGPARWPQPAARRGRGRRRSGSAPSGTAGWPTPGAGRPARAASASRRGARAGRKASGARSPTTTRATLSHRPRPHTSRAALRTGWRAAAPGGGGDVAVVEGPVPVRSEQGGKSSAPPAIQARATPTSPSRRRRPAPSRPPHPARAMAAAARPRSSRSRRRARQQPTSSRRRSRRGGPQADQQERDGQGGGVEVVESGVPQQRAGQVRRSAAPPATGRPPRRCRAAGRRPGSRPRGPAAWAANSHSGVAARRVG